VCINRFFTLQFHKHFEKCLRVLDVNALARHKPNALSGVWGLRVFNLPSNRIVIVGFWEQIVVKRMWSPTSNLPCTYCIRRCTHQVPLLHI
jgi:hypothetical protein